MKVKKHILLIFALMWYSCSTNIVYQENKVLENKQWDRKDLIKFYVNVEDTLSSHNIFITIRINGNYSRRNLYVFSRIKSPDSYTLVDTLNLLLADEKGHWFGKSNLGDLYYNKFLYKSDVRFPKKGQYTFIFEQAMRSEKIDNIEDFGLKIEKKQ